MAKYDVHFSIEVNLEYDSDDKEHYPDTEFPANAANEEIVKRMVWDDFLNMGDIELIQLSNEPTNLVINTIEAQNG